MIRIFSAKDIPYGQLHNDYKFNLEIEKQKYNSVSNYVYCNMVNNSQHKTALMNFEITKTFKNQKQQDEITAQQIKDKTNNLIKYFKRDLTESEKLQIKKEVENELFLKNHDIDTVYKYYIEQEQTNAIKTGLENGYKSRLLDDDFIRELKKYEGKILKMANNNEDDIEMEKNVIFDINIKDNINTILNQVVHEYKLSKLKESHESTLKQHEDFKYNIYKCEKIIEKEIKNIILKKEAINLIGLDNYKSKNPKEIVDFFRKQGGKEIDLGIFETNKDFILKKLIRNDLVDQIKKNPKNTLNIIILFKKQEIQEYIQKTRKNTVVEEYLKYIKQEKFPEYTIKDIMVEFQAGLTDSKSGEISNEYRTIQDEIYQCYQNNKLDEKFNRMVGKKIKNLDTIIENIFSINISDEKTHSSSSEETNEVMKAFKPESVSEIQEEKEEKEEKQQEEKQTITISKNNILSPYYNKKVVFENKDFDSIIQLVYYQLYLISATKNAMYQKGTTQDNARKLAKIENFQKNYLQDYVENEKILFKHYLKKAYNIKFNNPYDFVSILATTEGKEIFYINLTNNIVREICNELLKETKSGIDYNKLYKPIPSINKIVDLYTVVKNDNFIYRWYTNKLSEFMNTFYNHRYSLKNNDLNSVKTVIKNIYNKFLYDNIEISDSIIADNVNTIISLSLEFNDMFRTVSKDSDKIQNIEVRFKRNQKQIAKFCCQTILSVIINYIKLFDNPSIQQLKNILAESQYTISDEKECVQKDEDPFAKDLNCIYQSIVNTLENCKNISEEFELGKLEIQDVEFSRRLLLGLKPKKIRQQTKKEVTVPLEDYKQDELEKEYEYQDEDQEEQENQEQDYQDEEKDEQDEEEKTEFSMRQKMQFTPDISKYESIYKILLKEKQYTDDLSDKIWEIMSQIYFHRMHPHVKFMRINFFAV